MQFKHISVLPEKVLSFAPEMTQTILDCTLGRGGHSKALLEKFPNARLNQINLMVDEIINAPKKNFFMPIQLTNFLVGIQKRLYN